MTGPSLEQEFAREGRGCRHCETGEDIALVIAPAGKVRICFNCIHLWFPGRTRQWVAEWLERQEAECRRRHELKKARRNANGSKSSSRSDT